MRRRGRVRERRRLERRRRDLFRRVLGLLALVAHGIRSFRFHRRAQRFEFVVGLGLSGAQIGEGRVRRGGRRGRLFLGNGRLSRQRRGRRRPRRLARPRASDALFVLARPHEVLRLQRDRARLADGRQIRVVRGVRGTGRRPDAPPRGEDLRGGRRRRLRGRRELDGRVASERPLVPAGADPISTLRAPLLLTFAASDCWYRPLEVNSKLGQTDTI
mmetsp:Transcript_33290/g.100340  ORF Transcript_33290/g.100340 Transcript_33290/m.100340 type:complete len:216 (-) Transcript_33290:13-660(-)